MPLFFDVSSPLGRRCYRTYDLEKKECFVPKGAWRLSRPLRKERHHIYAKPVHKGVKHIPKVEIGRVRGVDGGRHECSRVKYCPRTFRHYRIVLEMLDGHLGSCHNVRDAVSAIRDASEAEAQASELAFVDHRDISYANIMVKYVDGKVEGYLIDWDTCIETDIDHGDEDILPERRGTWVFIAAQLILKENPNHTHSRIDNVESLFHVLLYITLLYTDKGLDADAMLWIFVDEYFQNVDLDPHGETSGGRGKEQFFRNRGANILRKIRNARLRVLIRDLIPPLGARYDEQPFEEYVGESGEIVCTLLDFPEDHYRLMETVRDVNWFTRTLTTHLDLTLGWDNHANLIPQRVPVTRNMKETTVFSLPAQALKHSTIPGHPEKRKGAPESDPPQERAPSQTRGEPAKKKRRTKGVKVVKPKRRRQR